MKLFKILWRFVCVLGLIRYKYMRLSAITLVTGLMGAGKTTFVMGYLLFLAKTEPDLTFYIVNFDGFKYDKINEMFKFEDSELGERFRPLPNEVFENYPAYSHDKNFKGSDELQVPCVIVVDECQDFFPDDRTSAKNLPLRHKGLNRIRHMGIELILMSPSRDGLHNHLLKRASSYVDLVRLGAAARSFIYVSFGTGANALKNCSESVFHFKDSDQSLFESSAVHTGAFSRKLPKTFFLGLLLVAVALFFIGRSIFGVFSYASSKDPEAHKANSEKNSAEMEVLKMIPAAGSSAVASSSNKDFLGRFAGCALIRDKRYCFFYDCEGKAIQPEYTFLSTKQVHIGGKNVDIGFNSCQDVKKGRT